jgi:hypothetical protein
MAASPTEKGAALTKNAEKRKFDAKNARRKSWLTVIKLRAFTMSPSLRLRGMSMQASRIVRRRRIFHLLSNAIGAA